MMMSNDSILQVSTKFTIFTRFFLLALPNCFQLKMCEVLKQNSSLQFISMNENK